MRLRLTAAALLVALCWATVKNRRREKKMKARLAMAAIVMFALCGGARADSCTSSPSTCNQFAANDAGATGDNHVAINENTGGTPTCAGKGAANTFRLLDSNASAAAVTVDMCNGTSLGWRFPSASTTTTNALFATATSGAPAYRDITDADVPNTITIDLATTATGIVADTSAGSTTTGVLHMDTNGGNSAMPEVTVGDGTNARLLGCQQIWFSGSEQTNGTYYRAPGAGGSTVGEAVKAFVAVPTTLTKLYCVAWKDVTNGNSIRYYIATAAQSSCSVASDGAATSCSWSASALDQTITGTTGTTDWKTSVDTSVVAVATTDVWQLVIVESGTLGYWSTCVIEACPTGVQ
jgi:hypothetical protein